MLKRTFLAVVLAGLASASFAQSNKAVHTAPRVVGAPVVSISAPQLGSMFDGAAGSRFNVRAFLGQNGFAARRDEFRQATFAVKAEAFARQAQALFGNAPIISRKPVRPTGVPSEGEMNDEVGMSHRENAERERIVQQLFVQAGAQASEIRKQDIGRGRNNYIVVKKGRTDKVIVVGAHHDKVSAGQGTIDNWTGTTMMINLYQQIREVDTEHTYVFIAFGREEEGLIGSAAYIRSLSQAEKSKIVNMVNLDTLGVDGTFTWKNNSDQNLLKAFRDTAARERLDHNEIVLNGGDADSSSFRRAGIRAITVFGASPEVIFDIIHSSRDNIAAFNLAHYVNSYKLTAAVLLALDRPAVPSF